MHQYVSIVIGIDYCNSPIRGKHVSPARRRLCLAVRVSYDDLAVHTALASDVRHKFLSYQLPTLRDWPTVALMGDGVSGFDSGEGA